MRGLLGRGSARGSLMVFVEKVGEFFAQTFVALALVAEQDGPLEQVMLHLLGQIAPCGNGGAPENA